MTTFHSPIHQTILIVLCAIAACRPIPLAIMEDNNCLPPCWNNIIPGQTTKKDVLNILSTLSEIDKDSIKDAGLMNEGVNNNIYWTSTYWTGRYGGRIYFSGEIVSVILISPKKGALSIGSAIQKLGEPENILAYTEVGDSPRIIVYILYPTNGFALLTYTDQFSGGSKASLDQNQSVMHIIYFKPEQFSEIFTSGPINFLNPVFLSESMQLWDGFGKISIKERP